MHIVPYGPKTSKADVKDFHVEPLFKGLLPKSEKRDINFTIPG